MPTDNGVIKGKPTGVVVPSDDFHISVGGKVYAPHSGETVTFYPTMAIADMVAYSKVTNQFQTLSEQSDPAVFEGALEALRALVGNLIKDWTWTAPEGALLPSPANNPTALSVLTPQELLWLVEKFNAILGADQKKEPLSSLPSP